MGIYQKILAGKITFPKIFHKEAVRVGGTLSTRCWYSFNSL